MAYKEYNQAKDERENPELQREYLYRITKYPVKYSEVLISPRLSVAIQGDRRASKRQRIRKNVKRIAKGAPHSVGDDAKPMPIRLFLERKRVPRISREVFFRKRSTHQEVDQLLRYRPHTRLIKHICCPLITVDPSSVTYEAQETGWLYLLHHYCFVPHNWAKSNDKRLHSLPQYQPIHPQDIWGFLGWVMDQYAAMVDFETAVFLFSYILFSSCKSLFFPYRTIATKGGKTSAKSLNLSLQVSEQDQERFRMFMEPLVSALMIVTNTPEDADTTASLIDQMMMRRDGEFSYADKRKPVSALANQMHDACFLLWNPPRKGRKLETLLDSAGSFILTDTVLRYDPTFLCVPFAADSSIDSSVWEGSNIGLIYTIQALQILFHGYVGYLCQAMNGEVREKLQQKLWKLTDEFDELPAQNPVPPDLFEQEPILSTIETVEQLYAHMGVADASYRGPLLEIDENGFIPEVDEEATEQRDTELYIQNKTAQKRIWLQRELTYPRPVRSQLMDRYYKCARSILNKPKGVHDQKAVAQHAPLLAMLLSFNDFLESVPCDDEHMQIRNRVQRCIERATLLMATRCLERPPLKQVCTEDNALVFLADFIGSLDASGMIESAEGGHASSDSCLGWRRDDGGRQALFLDYKIYFNAFTEYCEEKGYVMQLSEHRFVREILYPLGIVVPRSRSKDGTPRRYDYLKVLHKGEGKQLVLYLREDKLCEAAVSQFKEKRS